MVALATGQTDLHVSIHGVSARARSSQDVHVPISTTEPSARSSIVAPSDRSLRPLASIHRGVTTDHGSGCTPTRTALARSTLATAVR